MKRNRQWNYGALALALITLVIFAIGCGHQKQTQVSASSSAGQEAVAASASGPMVSPFGQAERGSISDPEIATVTNDSLPPDVAASVTDPLVTPGTIIEVTAKGSADVEEVLLSDGIGKPQRFAYDSAADLWRASYRVPVRIVGDRLGLAVTAKNDLGRWRRVWVFIGTRPEAPKDTVQVEEK